MIGVPTTTICTPLPGTNIVPLLEYSRFASGKYKPAVGDTVALDPKHGAEHQGAKAGVLYTVRELHSGVYPLLAGPDGAVLQQEDGRGPARFASWDLRPAVARALKKGDLVCHAPGCWR